MEFYDLQIKDTNGKDVQMRDYQGKVLLIVNTATKCGLAPQFEELEALHQKYKEKGLVVIGFPCAQFLNQEPETNETVVNACKINFGVTFLLTEKIDVNGSNVHPIFRYLKKQLPGGLFGRGIKWNFTKFLITADGKPYKRFAPATKPQKLEKDIIKLLGDAR